MEEKKEETITMSKSSLYLFTIGILALLLVASIFTQGFGIVKSPGSGAYVPNPSAVPSPNPSPSAVPSPTPAPAPAGPTLVVNDFIDDDPKIGSDSASIVMVEFSDFQCPFCRKFYADSFSSIDNDYIKGGKLQVVYRDFPLSFHPMAQKSAEAAECADEQGKFREFHDGIFAMQNEREGGVVKGTVQYTIEDVKAVAAKIAGINAATFNTCLDSGKNAAEVQADFTTGSTSFVEGTPAFLIGKKGASGKVAQGADGLLQLVDSNGKVVGYIISGAYPYATFKQAFDALLAA